MFRASPQTAPLWDDGGDKRGLRVAAVMLGITWPAAYFFTLMEDPGHVTPMWHFLGMGLLNLVPAALSLTRWGDRCFKPMLTVALFLVLGWAQWDMYLNGYNGRRISVGVVMVTSALALDGPLLLVAYVALMMGGVSLGLHLKPSQLPMGVAMGRVGAGAFTLLAITGMREWAKARVARSEERFRSLVMASPVATLIVQQDVCLLANAGAEALLGVGPGDRLSEALVGEPPWWLTPSRKGTSVVAVLGPNGEARRCELSYAPILGSPSGVQVTVVDRTQVPRPAGLSQDVLCAVVGRDLQRAVDLVQHALDSPEPPAGQLKARQDALRATQDMQRMLEDLVLLASLSSGGEQPLGDHSVGMMMDLASRRVAPLALHHGHTVTIHGPNNAAARLKTNLDAWVHAVANVLAHALEHTSTPGELRVEVQDGPDGRVKVLVPRPPSGLPAESLLGPTLAKLLLERVGAVLEPMPGPQGQEWLAVVFPSR